MGLGARTVGDGTTTVSNTTEVIYGRHGNYATINKFLNFVAYIITNGVSFPKKAPYI